MALLTERYADKIQGTISCFDRIVIGGTWPDICHARVLATLLKKQGGASVRLPTLGRTVSGAYPGERRTTRL